MAIRTMFHNVAAGISAISCVVLSAVSPVFTSNSAFAVENPVFTNIVIEDTSRNFDGAGTLEYVGFSTMLLKVANGVRVDLDSLEITQNGKTEKLPEYATDKDNIPVKLVYRATNDGIRIDSIVRYQDRDVWKCLAGIGGGVVTGGGTLGLGGAAVGTVTIPLIGTVSGGVVGAITGAVGGGLTGAATFCW